MRKNTKKCNWSDKVFKEIYEEVGGQSMLTGKPISNPTPFNFAHLLQKALNKYPEFMYYKKNIWLLTDYEHTLLDHGTKEKREKYEKECKEQGLKCCWNILYDMQDELKTEYKKLFE